MALTFEQIREKLAARFGDAVGPTVAAKDPFVVVKADRLLEVARFLKEEPTLALDYLTDETAVDHPKEELLRLVYHLWSMSQRHGFKLKVELPRAEAKAASVASVWPAANWLEREVFDLFGVRFDGHPDLRRIMMPEDWEGHPLRKDYQEPDGYHGIGHKRASTLEANLERDRRLRAALSPKAPAPEAKPADPVPDAGKA